MNNDFSTNYIIELHQVGKAVKVSAIDPVSMTEVSVICPLNISQDEMQQVAIRKLEYMMKKNADESGYGSDIIA